MTEQTRRTVLRYGIAIDLVILVTGVGMLVPPTANLLIFGFAAAVALSAWKGAWQGGLAALVLSVVAFAGVFPELASAATVVELIGISLGAGAAGAFIAHRRTSAQTSTETPVVDADVTQAKAEAEVLAEQAPLAEVVQLRQVPDAGSPEEEGVPAHSKAGNGSRGRSGRRRREKEAAKQAEAMRRAEAEAKRARAAEAERAAAAEAEARRGEAARIAAEESERRQAEESRAAASRAEEDRVEAERLAAERDAKEQLAAERERLARELDDRLAREREDAARELQRKIEAERAVVDAARQQAEAERRAVEEELRRLEEERQAAEAERQRVEEERKHAESERARIRAERARIEEETKERIARQREEAQQALLAKIEEEKRVAEEEARRRLDEEREAIRSRVDAEIAAERARIEQDAESQLAAARSAASEKVAASQSASSGPATPTMPRVQKPTLIDTVTGWFRRETRPRTVNLSTKRVPLNGSASKKPQPSPLAKKATQAGTKARILMIERRRGTADTVIPRLRQKNVEAQVVERWVDAVDEIFRLRPHAVFLDIEHPEFDRVHRTLTDKASHLPIVLTGRSGSSGFTVRHAAFVPRPYDADDLIRIAHEAHARPQEMLAHQSLPPGPATPAPKFNTSSAPPAAVTRASSTPRPAPPPVRAVQPIPLASMEPPASAPVRPVTPVDNGSDDYEVACFTCRAPFNAVDADWCSCLAKERTLVCTNCLACFCKAPASYKEKFWVEAPPRLFERKSGEARRQQGSLPVNPPKDAVVRPLVLTVEDDEEIQAIVQRVCSNLGYGFIWATNGQDGLDLAREYRPNLILSDAFMPKLDGREMCRMLKEEPMGADCRMVVMTGLYTDTKYRSEAVKRFHVDDYVAKPVAITDLINLLQKHLEGVAGLPVQEDAQDEHRHDGYEEEELTVGEEQHTDGGAGDDMPLSELLTAEGAMKPAPAAARREGYEVCCFNCEAMFDATKAEWCSCVGRDNTLVCEHCGGCFCKAPAAYRERFWIDAPPSLFERKMIGSKRHLDAGSNPSPLEIKRPLILLVEDDENVQLIVKTVVSSMGYGFVVGANGQEGLSLAREYTPDLILSDAFMPKLDGREMCRLLKEDPTTATSKAIIMTGLYTDRKYRNEALDYFKVDDYVAKPLAVDDLIKLFKKHLPQEVTTAH